ncbi:MAG: AbrB family transcriptional regulator [Burkholderiales bacterium]|nr:AbrB family transcriptional regulator [Burkholderiales bacterium]
MRSTGHGSSLRGQVARVRRGAAALAIGAGAGYVCALLHTPIPWMLGPLFTLAVLRVGGADVAAPRWSRYVGQWIIGTSLGLYFTPYVLREVSALWWLPTAGAVFAIGLGYVAGIALARMAGFDRTTGIFASVPGGATEMSILGDRFGGRMDRIAAAQSMRILIVVAIVPAAITAAGVHGADAYLQGAKTFDGIGFAILLALTLAGSVVCFRLRVPNGFVIGALAVSIPLTGMSVDLSLMPSSVSNAGQCLLGCALGSRFQDDFLRGARRFVTAVVVTVLLSVALSAAFGIGLAWAAGQPPATLLLGTAPGGMAEMCITAKVLQLGVPLVTAFHVMRLVVLLLATPVIFPRARAWYRRRYRRHPPG